jgi:hypothetical protein
LAEIFILLLPFDCGENCFENWLGKVFKFWELYQILILVKCLVHVNFVNNNWKT